MQSRWILVLGLVCHSALTASLVVIEDPWAGVVGWNGLFFMYGVPFVLIFGVLYEVLKLRRSFMGEAVYFYLLGLTPYLLTVLWLGSRQVGWEQWGVMFFAGTALLISWVMGGVVFMGFRVYQRVSNPHTKIPR